jgi:hypothetical protein
MNNDGLIAAVRVLARIADAYDANELDDEARKHWGENDEHTNVKDPKRIELYTGRGGGTLLTLQDCLNARSALACPQITMTAQQYEELLHTLDRRIQDASPFEQASLSVSYRITQSASSATVVMLYGFVEYGEQQCAHKHSQFILLHKRLVEEGYMDRKATGGLRRLREALNLPPAKALRTI